MSAGAFLIWPGIYFLGHFKQRHTFDLDHLDKLKLVTLITFFNNKNIIKKYNRRATRFGPF
jgi:hypothetical protein